MLSHSHSPHDPAGTVPQFSQNPVEIKSIKKSLRQMIVDISSKGPSLPELIEQLHQNKIDCVINLQRLTVVYQVDRLNISGTQLGKSFTLKGLMSLGVSFDLERDRKAIEKLTHRQRSTKPTSADDTNPASDESGDDFWSCIDGLPRQLPDRNDETWNLAKQRLKTFYKLPSELIELLYQEGWLYSDSQSNTVFVERTLEDEHYHGLVLAPTGYLHPTDPNQENHRKSCFWMATAEPFERAIILDDPTEALSLYALEHAVSLPKATLYLCARSIHQIPTDLLTIIPKLYASESCISNVRNFLKKGFPATIWIHPQHQDSWRGVWQDRTPQDPKKSEFYRSIKPQRQLQI